MSVRLRYWAGNSCISCPQIFCQLVHRGSGNVHACNQCTSSYIWGSGRTHVLLAPDRVTQLLV